MTKQAKILWSVWVLYVLATIIATFFYAGQIKLDFSGPLLITLGVLALPLVMLILHSSWTLSLQRAGGFIILAVLVGFLFEYLGLNYGVTFGGHYRYAPLGPHVFGVPVIILAYWAAFAYNSYVITNSFLQWQKKHKPHRATGDWWRLLGLVVFDAYLLMAIDLILDPLQVHQGSWSWLEGGPYFGVPIGNFIGWFMVGLLISLIFRTYEYFFPHPHIPDSLSLIPLFGYGVLGLSLVITAVMFGLAPLGWIGIAVMLGPTAVNLWFYHRQKNYKSN